MPIELIGFYAQECEKKHHTVPVSVNTALQKSKGAFHAAAPQQVKNYCVKSEVDVGSCFTNGASRLRPMSRRGT